MPSKPRITSLFWCTRWESNEQASRVQGGRAARASLEAR